MAAEYFSVQLNPGTVYPGLTTDPQVKTLLLLWLDMACPLWVYLKTWPSEGWDWVVMGPLGMDLMGDG